MHFLLKANFSKIQDTLRLKPNFIKIIDVKGWRKGIRRMIV